jgi:hypothetical protein
MATAGRRWRRSIGTTLGSSWRHEAGHGGPRRAMAALTEPVAVLPEPVAALDEPVAALDEPMAALAMAGMSGDREASPWRRWPVADLAPWRRVLLRGGSCSVARGGVLPGQGLSAAARGRGGGGRAWPAA